MTLRASASVTLGRKRYDAHAAGVTVTLVPLPGAGSARVVLPERAALDAGPGDDAMIELDGGEGAARVLSGKIRAIRRSHAGSEALVADGAADLAALRPSATYQRQGAREIIRALADDAGVSVGAVEVDLPLAAYVAHPGRTAAEHIASLAALGGAAASFGEDGELQVLRAGDRATVALRHGRELLALEGQDGLPPRAARIPIGSGPGGATEAPEALRPSLEPIPSSAPDPGSRAIWLPAPILRTPAAARAAREALAAEDASAVRRVRGSCFLSLALRPGVVVEVQGLPASRELGPFRLVWVRHSIGGGGAITEFTAVSAGGDSALGAAAAAIGGLL